MVDILSKTILVLTVVAGGGHNSAAISVTTRIKEIEPDAEIQVVDILKTYSVRDFYITKYGYATLIGKLPFIYAAGYWLSNHGLFKNFYASAPLRIARNIAPKLYKMINETKPDVIYCTHFYPAMALSLLRQAYIVPPVVIASSLDYAVEPFFDKARNVDYITIANEEFIPGRLHSGYTLEQIKVTGIPTQDKFYTKPNKLKLRKELGMGAFAKILLPRIKELSKTKDVVLDGLYSWDEYLILKEELENLKVIAIVTDKEIRYSRLENREIRPLTKEEAQKRDLSEIENIQKAPPIAYADYYVLNNGSLEEYKERLESIIKEI